MVNGDVNLHGDDDVSSWSEDAQQLGQGRGVDLAGGEPVGGGDHVVGLVVDWDGAEAVQVRVDVVLVDALGARLAQHAQRAVQPVHVHVSVAADLCPQQPGARSQVQDGHLLTRQGVRMLVLCDR